MFETSMTSFFLFSKSKTFIQQLKYDKALLIKRSISVHLFIPSVVINAPKEPTLIENPATSFIQYVLLSTV
jgi:hypothetical protein